MSFSIALRAVLSAALFGSCLPAQEIRALDPSRHPHPEQILSNWLQALAAKQLAARKAEVDAIQDKAAYEQRKARMRAAALRMIGGLDEPRTPLNIAVTGKLERDGYRVEKLHYQSRPGLYVTANLYVPTIGKPPYPAILHPVGHSASAKNRAFYQTISLGLVKSGFVVLIYDPIGQGERRIFWDKDLGDSKVGGTTTEHTMVGWQNILAGESIAKYKVWDAMRSIDVLASRPEVDSKRIGVTGCSGGGTLTTYVAALDDRIQAAAPACYISSWDEQLQGTGPQDAEQQFPDQLVAGLNHSDWIGLAAPKPYLIVSTDQDFFPLEGARKSFQEMKRIYTLYDAAAKVEWFHEPGGHGMPKASREAVYAWMKQWLRGESSPTVEPPLTTEFEEDLNVTPTGQVSTSLGGDTASTLNMKRYAQRVPSRPSPVGIETLRVRIQKEIKETARVNESKAPLLLEKRGEVTREGIQIQLLSWQTEEGLVVPAAFCASTRKDRVAVYLDPAGKENALKPGGDIAELVKAGYSVLAPDLSGIGEVAYRKHPASPWGQAGLVWLTLMTGRPLSGIRIQEVRRGLDALRELGYLLPEGVTAIARGRLGPVLLETAVLDPRIAAVVIDQSLVSFHAVAANPVHKDVEDAIIPGALGRFDLPDIVAALAPQPVSILNSTSPTGRILARRESEAEYRYAAAVYAALKASNRFTVGLRRESESIAASMPTNH